MYIYIDLVTKTVTTNFMRKNKIMNIKNIKLNKID